MLMLSAVCVGSSEFAPSSFVAGAIIQFLSSPHEGGGSGLAAVRAYAAGYADFRLPERSSRRLNIVFRRVGERVRRGKRPKGGTSSEATAAATATRERDDGADRGVTEARFGACA